MGKLVAIETFERFLLLLNDNQILDTSLIFILDTGLFYTHGILFNSVSYGAINNDTVTLNVGGTSKVLSLASHTHSNYYAKNADLDIDEYKIVSGSAPLLYYEDDVVKVGSTSTPTYLHGTLSAIRGNNTYTILDTGNTSIENKTISGVSMSNVATFKYGNSNFLLDYVKRENTIIALDTLASYTNMGTTNENSKFYGFMTMYTDGRAIDPKFAQIRINIDDNILEFRSSSNRNWTGLLQGGAYKNITINGTTYSLVTKSNSLPTLYIPTSLGSGGQCLSVADDGGSLVWRSITIPEIVVNSKTQNGVVLKGQGNPNKVWMTDADGAPNWRDLNVNSILSAATTTVLGGIKVQLVNANAVSSNTSAETSGRYYGVRIDANELAYVNVPWENTWTAWAGATTTADGTSGYMPGATIANRLKYLRGDGTWQDLNNYSLPTASNTTLGGVKTGAAVTDVSGLIAVHIKDGIIYYKDTTYTFYNLAFHNGTSVVDTYKPTTSPSKTLKAGSNVSISAASNIITIASTNTWKAATTSQEGYAPKLTTGGGTIATLSTEYVLTFKSGTDSSPVWRLLPSNAYNDHTYTVNNNTFRIKSLVGSTTTTLSDFTANQASDDDFTLVQGSNITFTVDATNRKLTIAGTANTWKAANASQEGYVPKSTANKILRSNGNGALYWGDDANTTYTFYNLLFQNSGGTTVDTYKPTTSPTKTLKAGSNVTISAASNVITIASTNTWNANAVGVAGYVAAPTKASNANMTWQTDANGNPAWRASNNHSHSYLPLSGANYNTSTDTNPFKISRGGGNNECLSISVNDNRVLFHHMLDETTANFVFKGEWDNSESGDTSKAGSHTVAFNLNYGAASITLDNYTVYHTGNLPAYPTKASWNYDDRYVSSLTTSGNYLRWVKNGSNNDITIPYATSSNTTNTFTYANNWNVAYASNKVNFITCGGTAASGAPGGYYSGVSFMTSYVGFLLVTYGGSTENLLFRKIQDNNSWKSWRTIIHDGNIGSQSVNYAKSAGNATYAGYLTLTYCNSSTNSGLWNTIKNGSSNTVTNKVNFYTIYNNGGPTTYGEMLEILSYNANHWQPQLWFAAGKSAHLYYRNKNYNDNSWGNWLTILDSDNSSVSKSGETLTVKINGTSQSLTNTNTTYSGSSTVTLSGTTFSLTKANVTTALGYTPPTTNSTYNFSGTTFYSGNSGTAEHNCNNAVKNGTYYYTSNGPSGLGNSTSDGGLYVQSYSDSWVGQIAQDYRNGRLWVRGRNNGSWQSWIRIANYNEIPSSLPANGGNADTVDSQHFKWSNDSNSPTYLWAANSSGTAFLAARGSISVNYANSAGSVAWGNVSGKPFNWSGQSGQPTWLWGSNDGSNYYVWNPSNFSVNYASSAGYASSCGSFSGAWAIEGGNEVNLIPSSFGSNRLWFNYTAKGGSHVNLDSNYFGNAHTGTVNCYAASFGNSSDIRYKQIIEYVDLSLEQVAYAPIFKFYWTNKSDSKLHAGSSALYWLGVVRELVHYDDYIDLYFLNYGETALISAVTVAKETLNLKNIVLLLQSENELLKGRISMLESTVRLLTES